MRVVKLEKPVKLSRDDGTEIFYPAGDQAMPEADAEHWWVKAHIAKAPPPALGDHEFARALRNRADEARTAWEAIERVAVEAEEAFAAKSAAASAKAELIARVTAPPAPGAEKEDTGSVGGGELPPAEGAGSGLGNTDAQGAKPVVAPRKRATTKKA